jgi:nucleoside-diphosphate-sugar epimerase
MAKVLLTGAFGNIGPNAAAAILEQGHQLRCFDRETEATRKKAKRFEGRVDIIWGDLCNDSDVAAAVAGCEVVIHMGFALPPFSERYPDKARDINVGGTQRILNAMKASTPPPKIIFLSTSSVFKLDPNNRSARTAADPVEATDNYSRHKLECEQLVRGSGLEWCIFRMGSLPPIVPEIGPWIFLIPFDTHMPFLHPRDAGRAMANAVSSREIWGKILLIASGAASQICYKDFVEKYTRAAGIGMLLEEAFSTKPYYIVWMDTTESQRLLNYQRYSFADFARDMPAKVGPRRYKVMLLRPRYRRRLLAQSPFLKPKA